MHFPELSLSARSQRGFVRLGRQGVKGEGSVAEHVTDLPGIRPHELAKNGRYPAAERALEVGKLDDGDSRIGRAHDGGTVGNGTSRIRPGLRVAREERAKRDQSYRKRDPSRMFDHNRVERVLSATVCP